MSNSSFKVVERWATMAFKSGSMMSNDDFKAVQHWQTTLKPSRSAFRFQNRPASFKTVQPILKLSDDFEAGQVLN